MNLIELMRQKEYENALSQLELSHQTHLKILSLFYQYTDDYSKELELVNKSLELYPDFAYMLQRQTWHQLSYMEKMVPRPKINSERALEKIPSQEFLEQLCFVTACDSGYFEMTLGLIESIKATSYKNVLFFVLDVGLKPEQKAELAARVDNIKRPGWSIKLPSGRNYPQIYKAKSERAFLEKYFPGYRYYFWMDADVWVQDESALDRYTHLCQKQGIGVARNFYSENFMSMHSCSCNKTRICDELWDESLFYNSFGVNSGVWCVDVQTNILNKFGKILQKNVLEIGDFGYYFNQAALNVVLAQHKISEILDTEDNFMIRYDPNVYYDPENPYGLYVYHTGLPIGIVHNADGENKRTYDFSIQGKDGAKERYIPVHYLVYPWQGRDEILQEILAEENKLKA